MTLTETHQGTRSGHPTSQHEGRCALLSGEKVGTTGRVTIAGIGSGGILLATEYQLAPGQLVELSVSWPALELVARGHVVYANQANALFSIGQPAPTL